MSSGGAETLIIANPVSGGGRGHTLGDKATALLHERGLAARLAFTTGPGDGERIAREALAAGVARFAVAGGDGTVHEVVNALAGSAAVLGLLPCGRGNDLARVLGVPGEVERAVELLVTGRERRIDLGRVGGRHFATVASMGFDSEAAERVHSGAVPFGGSAGYVYAVLRTLASYRSPQVTIRGDFGEFTGEVLLAATGNTSTYGAGMKIAPRAVCDDGLLDLCIVRALHPVTVLRYFPRIFAGTHENLPFVAMHRARRVSITTSRPIWIYADGEPICRTPAEIEVVPQALTVLCPATG